MTIKFLTALVAASVLHVSAAQAEDLKLGCMPKEQLQKLMKPNKLSAVDQYMRSVSGSEIKTTVVSEHDGTGFVDLGRGYIIESRDNNACVIEKTRLDYGPKENQFAVSVIRSLGNVELTLAEWQYVNKFAKENKAEIERKMKDGTLGKNPQKKTSIPPGSSETDYLYEFTADKIIPLKRGKF